MKLTTKIQNIIKDLQTGKPILIIDSENREGEIDAMILAEHATTDSLAFLISKCRGLMCVTMTRERANQLQIPAVPTNNKDKFSTAFQCPVDAAEGVTTGMSVSDRLVTLGLLVNDSTTPDQLSYPGHLQVLVSRAGLFKDRQGHTESSMVCAKLANSKSVGVIVELIDKNGKMVKSADVKKYASKFKLHYISVDELMQYCKENNLSWAI